MMQLVCQSTNRTRAHIYRASDTILAHSIASHSIGILKGRLPYPFFLSLFLIKSPSRASGLRRLCAKVRRHSHNISMPASPSSLTNRPKTKTSGSLSSDCPSRPAPGSLPDKVQAVGQLVISRTIVHIAGQKKARTYVRARIQALRTGAQLPPRPSMPRWATD